MKHMERSDAVLYKQNDGSFRVCECCYYPAPLITYRSRPKGRLNLMCELCYSSRAGGRWAEGFHGHDEQSWVGSHAIFAANAVLDQLGAFDKYAVKENGE